LIARIDGAFVEVSTGVGVDEVSPANLKIAGIVKFVFGSSYDPCENCQDPIARSYCEMGLMVLPAVVVIAGLCCID
jgi:hypothetical protein